MTRRTDIINSLFSNYDFKSYLEIGVHYPSANFNLINASIKESVDPKPMGVCTYKTTSDDFFEKHVKDKKYDVIFIDGKHTEEQAYRDAKNSINHLTDGGFIVMHDCNPPNEEYTNENQYCGTVFKAIIRLKHELSDCSCFVVDVDYGCGIITKRNILKNIQSNYDTFDFTWEMFNKNKNELLQLISVDMYAEIITNNEK